MRDNRVIARVKLVVVEEMLYTAMLATVSRAKAEYASRLACARAEYAASCVGDTSSPEVHYREFG